MKLIQERLISRAVSNYVKLGMLSILLLGGAVRLMNLATWSFWTDEIPTLYNAQHFVENLLLDFRSVLLVYPVTSLLIYIPIELFGPGEWTARLLPAVVGIVSAPILYIQVRNVFNPAVAIISALLLAVSPWHIYWSQNARFYIVLFLFYNLALFAIYQGFEKDKPQYIVFSMIFLGLAVSERLFSLLFVPVIGCYIIGLWLLPFERPTGINKRNLALIVVPGLIIGLFFAGQFILSPSDWMDKFSGRNSGPARILISFIRNVDLGVIGMGLLGAYVLLRQKSRAGFLMVLNATIPILIIMGASLIQFARDRYAFVSLASWIILAAYAAYVLIEQSRREHRVLIFGTLATLLVLFPLKEVIKYHTMTNGDRANLKLAYQFVVDNRAPQDLLFSDRSLVGFYYLREQVYSLGDVTDQEELFSDHVKERPSWFVVGGSGVISKRIYQEIEDKASLMYADTDVNVYFYAPLPD